MASFKVHGQYTVDKYTQTHLSLTPLAYIFYQLIEIGEGKKKKKNLNYITAADQPTDSRPPEATSATSTNIDRVPISFLHFIINMKLVHKSSLSYRC